MEGQQAKSIKGKAEESKTTVKESGVKMWEMLENAQWSNESRQVSRNAPSENIYHPSSETGMPMLTQEMVAFNIEYLQVWNQMGTELSFLCSVLGLEIMNDSSVFFSSQYFSNSNFF